jgi:hypothetical protein
MANRQAETTSEPKMDASTLYREEVFTDRRVGTIRRLTPVTPDGAADNSRETLYVGEAQMLTPAGALPITFEIGARSLKEAIDNFGPMAKEAVERTVKEIQEMRRQAASSIVVPSGGMPGVGPSGGKIQIP